MKPVKISHAVLVVLFGVAFLVPGLFLSGVYFRGFLQWWEARGWEEIPCRIEAAELKSSSGGDSTTYEVTASYGYRYQGRVYQGDRVGFSSGSDNIGGFHQRAYRELASYRAPRTGTAEAESSGPAVRSFRCYVNPAKPEDAVLYRELRWEMQAFMAIFALTFPAVGGGVVAFGWLSFLRLWRERRLQDIHPGEPWRWKPAWTGPSIPETSGKWRAGLYGYTLWAAAVVAPLLVCSWAGGAFSQGGTVWMLLIFPALWCIPAGLSWRRLRQRAAVGAARLEMKTMPVGPGTVLDGEVVLGRAVRSPAGAEASLVCERQTTRRRGKNTSISTETVWEAEDLIGSDRIVGDVGYCRIPVRFVVPSDAPVTGPDPVNSAVEVNWKLKLKGPATAIAATFEVPVFRDPNAPVIESAALATVPSISADRSAKLPELLGGQRLIADFDDHGHLCSLHSPAARNRMLIGFLIVFDLIWTAVAVFLVRQQAPLIFQIVWPVSAALIWGVICWQLLHRRTVTFGGGGLVVLNRLGPAQWRLNLPRERIAGYSFDSNMQSNNRNFYRVRVEDIAGKQHTLVSGISEAGTAEALTQHLETIGNGSCRSPSSSLQSHRHSADQ